MSSSSAMSAARILLAAVAVAAAAAAGGAFALAADPAVEFGSFGRHLLQAKKSCPVNFEFLNYTIITSKCKGPQYPPTLCCGALKEFACPFAEYLNDGTNDCASTMFSYINLYGKYPPGLFASECREGKNGLACSANGTDKEAAANAASAGHRATTLISLAALPSGILLAILLI